MVEALWPQLSDNCLEVETMGKVAVVQSSSESAHWPDIDQRIYRAIPGRLPWLEPEFFDESSVSTLLTADIQACYSGLIFSSGAMALATVRNALDAHADQLRRALHAGTGIMVCAPFLTEVESFRLQFLDGPSQVSLVSLPHTKELRGSLQIQGRHLQDMDGATNPLHCYKVSSTASQSIGWRPHAVVRTTLNGEDEAREEVVAWRTSEGRGRVIVATFPLERATEATAFDEAIVRITRSRGHLIVGSGQLPDWYGSRSPGAFAARITNWQCRSIGQTISCFSHLQLGDLPPEARPRSLTRTEILHRLENDGSVSFPVRLVGEDPAYMEIAGTPEYLSSLRSAEPWLRRHLGSIVGGPTFHILAMAVAASVAADVVKDAAMVPELFRMGTVSLMCQEAFHRRIKDGNVDNRLLPTMNLYVACRLSGTPETALRETREWMDANAHTFPDDEIAQACWAARLLPDDDLLMTLPRVSEAASTLGRLSLTLERESGISIPEPAQLSSLEATLVAFTTEWEIHRKRLPSDHEVWPLPRPSDTAGIEERLYRLAAQSLSSERQPLRSSTQPGTGEGEGPLGQQPPVEGAAAASEVVSMLRAQASLELDRQRSQVLEKELHHARSWARRLIAVLYCAWLVLLGGGSAAVLMAFQPELADVLSLLGIAVLLSLAPTVLLVGSAHSETVTPRWMVRLLRVTAQVRKGEGQAADRS